MYQTLEAPAPVDRSDTVRTPVRAPAHEDPVVDKMRGLPLIATWVVLAGAPWVVVWQVLKHAL
ncbi:hypothetical protein [Azospirillum sp. ST 5-10]|uniref:hypothetical protein n=1 Tax=unclassified Azospirillum TaxID=2630922 RepID=UPI003F4A4789